MGNFAGQKPFIYVIIYMLSYICYHISQMLSIHVTFGKL